MNLLTEPSLPVLTTKGTPCSYDLAELCDAYARDEVADHLFLRPHQRSSWHSFCVQLAALALHRGGHDVVVEDAGEWRQLLRGLTTHWPGDEPWHLVVEDVTRPAFMQPPVPKGVPDPHKTMIATPDDLDTLVSSKNHGLKQAIAGHTSPADWVSALVSLQTTGGFLGAGNYGIARMNGGFATRPFVGLVPGGGPGAHWRRDVRALLRWRRSSAGRIEGFDEDDGAALLWCLPWDGKRSLAVDALDPWFIEICRRVRLYDDATTGITARSVGSAVARIAAKDQKGNVGDPWIPIALDRDSAAYNTAPTYRVMSDVLFDGDKWRRPLLLEWQEGIDSLPMRARFDVLARGQGTTEGLHRREVLIDRPTRRTLFASLDERDRLAALARDMVEQAGTLRNRVVKIALLTLAQGGKPAADLGDKTGNAWIGPWLEAIEREIEASFFDSLFDLAETDDKARWPRFLQATAREVFRRAVDALPMSGARRLKAVAVAEQKLDALFWKSFMGYLEDDEVEVADAG